MEKDKQITIKEKFDNLVKKTDKINNLGEQVSQFKLDKGEIVRDKTRFEITRMFLSWFFGLMVFSFFFCLFYNAAFILWGDKLVESGVKPVDIATILPLITTTLGTGLGFIMGYYFKGDERD